MGNKTIIDLIRQQATSQPDAVAISTEDGGVSYAKLITLVDRLSDLLVDSNLTCVALLSDNNLAWVLTDLACLNAGICCVPVPGFFTSAQIKHICRQTGAQAIVGDGSACFLEDSDADFRETFRLDDHFGLFVHAFPLRESQDDDQTFGNFNPKQVAKITFTSGSTGSPKGVCLTRENIENTVSALDKAITPDISQSHLSVLPLVTLLENIAGVYLPLIRGATLILRSMKRIGFTGLAKLDYPQFFRSLNEIKPQSMILVPELLRVLVRGVEHRLVDPENFRLIAVGGGSIDRKLLHKAESLGLPVVQGYGLSESCSVVALNTPEHNRIGSVGKPLDHVKVRIADDGEVLVMGNTMAGYLENENAHPNNRPMPWLPTGDIGTLDNDGYLYITGRKKNLIVSSYGKNISPEWLETMLQQSELVQQVAVIGDADTSIKAIIVPSGPGLLKQIQMLVKQTNETLPEYARIAACTFATEPFRVENGMLTANGRLKRNAIIEHYASPNTMGNASSIN